MTTKAPMPADFASHWNAALSQLVDSRRFGERGAATRAGASAARAVRCVAPHATSKLGDLAFALVKDLTPAHKAHQMIRDASYQAWLLRGFQ